MIDAERLLARVANLHPDALDHWVAMAWVRPEVGERGTLFQEIDVARVILIRDLTEGMRVDEEVLPLVLSLLDQLYDARRRMRELGEALTATAPDELRLALLKCLTEPPLDREGRDGSRDPRSE